MIKILTSLYLLTCVSFYSAVDYLFKRIGSPSKTAEDDGGKIIKLIYQRQKGVGGYKADVLLSNDTFTAPFENILFTTRSTFHKLMAIFSFRKPGR